MIPSSAELTLLRTQPQATKLWLSIYEPEVALSALVTGTSSTPSMTCNYYSVSQGNFALIESGMTMYIGTTPGASDVGKIRVKSATASTITTAENAEIVWTQGHYITVVRFFEINTVFPRIILQPGTDPNPDTTLWYKDYDIDYTWQNDVLGTFICMGSHYAGFLETGSCQVYYTSAGTSNVIGQTISYNWWFEGGTVTGSALAVPGYITYDTPGHYTTRLQITTATGTYDVGYRHISIYDRPGVGPNTPILKWNLKSLSGGRDSGGYTARITVYEDFSSVKDGALVVIFADDYYGTTKQSIGNAALRGSIVFVGYIMDGSISVNYQTSSMEFTVGSPTEIMKQIEAFAVGVNSSADPANEPSTNPDIPSSWAVVKDMNCKRAIYHYLRWHSTALMCNDFVFSGTDQNIEYFDADRESLYSAVQTLMDGSLAGEFVCSRDGKMWAEISAGATDSATTAFNLNMSLENYDWIGQIKIDEAATHKISFLEMGGIYFAGPGYGSVPYLASAPGSAPSYRGFNERLSGLALGSDQADLNTLVGNVYAWKNSRYPSVYLDLAGNYRNLDIAPIEKVQLTMDSSDNIRGISWNRKEFVVRDMSFTYNAEQELLLPSITLHEITQGISGATITIPDIPPTAGGEDIGGGFSIPPIQIPPFPPIPIPSVDVGGGGGNFPIFVPVQSVYLAGTANAWDYLKAFSITKGPTVASTQSGNDDVRVYGGFVVPNGYNGTVDISLVYIPQFTGNADLEVEYDPYIKGAPGWSLDSGNVVYSFSTVAVTSGSTLKLTVGQTVTVSSLGFVSLWAAFDATTSDGYALYLVGWYIQYNG